MKAENTATDYFKATIQNYLEQRAPTDAIQKTSKSIAEHNISKHWKTMWPSTPQPTGIALR